VSDNIESNGLRKRTALANRDNITFLDREGRGAVGSDVLVSLFKTTVLPDVVKIISSDNDRSLHLGGDDLTREDTSSNGDISGEGALLVNEGSLDGGIRGLDSKSNVLHEAHRLLAGRSNSTLASYKDGILFLVGLFVLIALDVILSYADHFMLTILPSGFSNREKKKKRCEV